MIRPGACVVVGLHSPREKLWGILTSIDPSGVTYEVLTSTLLMTG